MTNNSFDHNDGILTIKARGKLTFEYMIRGIELLESGTDFPRNLRILEDGTDAKMEMSIDELDFVIERLKMVANKFDLIRHAVVIEDPLNTAFAMLISKNTQNRRYILRVFSSIEGAKKWLES